MNSQPNPQKTSPAEPVSDGAITQGLPQRGQTLAHFAWAFLAAVSRRPLEARRRVDRESARDEIGSIIDEEGASVPAHP